MEQQDATSIYIMYIYIIYIHIYIFIYIYIPFTPLRCLLAGSYRYQSICILLWAYSARRKAAFMLPETFGQQILNLLLLVPYQSKTEALLRQFRLTSSTTSQRPFKYSMPLQDEVVAHLEPPGIPSQSSQWKIHKLIRKQASPTSNLTDSFGFDAGPFQVI